MNLTNYTQIEQAREDVKALLAGREEFVGPDGICLVTGPEGKWRAVNALDDAGELLARAYYRPDGDRYVVTDLGEGVRALRLRTGESAYGPATGVAMLEKLKLYDVENPRNALGGMAHELELAGVQQADLPDAICRVMLASLRVAQS